MFSALESSSSSSSKNLERSNWVSMLALLSDGYKLPTVLTVSSLPIDSSSSAISTSSTSSCSTNALNSKVGAEGIFCTADSEGGSFGAWAANSSTISDSCATAAIRFPSFSPSILR